jgi:hypothetical protein
MLQLGVDDVGEDDDDENQLSQSQVHVTAFQGTDV